ncbi:hypothetical protein IWQ60_007169, partial [Tieghemiomyces parasiticus]
PEKKAKKASKSRDEDDDVSEVSGSEVEEDLSVMDKSNIIPESGGRGRRTTRGNRIDYRQFGPDPDDSE